MGPPIHIRETLRRTLGFGSLGEYAKTGYTGNGIATFPRLVSQRLLAYKPLGEMAAAEGQTELKRTLGWASLISTGVGFMLGAGIFISPGYIATALTGPALFLAYGVAAISAFLSAFCYSEFTVNVPLAGASYNYVYSTLGEFIAWIAVSNLILEYILANAASVRGWSAYFGLLVNKSTTYFLHEWKGPNGTVYKIDGWAGGITLVCTCMLAYGIQESATANNIITIAHVLFVVIIIVVGLTKADRANMKPFFLPGGTWKDVFNGGAIAFFSYLGFDAVATTAEEVIDPPRDLPIGILGSVSVVTILYMLMTVTLTLMVPTSEIDPNAAFAAAFGSVGYQWAKYIIALTALMGIFTTTLIGILGSSRIVVGAARERMLPPFFATVGERCQTPWVATWAVGICSAGIAIFTDFAYLSDMISIGTFLVFMIVAIALLWLRCHVPGKSTRKNVILLTIHTFALLGLALGFTLVWKLPTYQDGEDGYTNDYGDYIPPVIAGKWNKDQWKWLLGLGLSYIAAILSFYLTVSQDYVSTKYKIPFFPTIPAMSIFVNIFLMGQLKVSAYKSFGWWTLGSLLFYFLYGMIAQQAHENRQDASSSSMPGHDDLDANALSAAKLGKEVQLSEAPSVDGAVPPAPAPAAAVVSEGTASPVTAAK